MFGFVQWILERLLDALDPHSLSERRRKAAVRQVGQHLLAVYNCTLDIVTMGEHIVYAVERSIADLHKDAARGLDRPVGTNLRQRLVQQASNLDAFDRAIAGVLSTQFLLPGAALDRLRGLVMRDKSLHLWTLWGLLFAPNPDLVTLTVHDLQRLMEGSEERPRLVQDLLVSALEQNASPLSGPGILHREDLPVLENWLKNEDPHSRLNEIKELSEKLRLAIVENFTLDELLPPRED